VRRARPAISRRRREPEKKIAAEVASRVSAHPGRKWIRDNLNAQKRNGELARDRSSGKRETTMPNPKMMILRGNSAKEPTYPDEEGVKVPYRKGALHEGAAREYATLRGRDPVVLDVSGDALANGNRDKNPQTVQALLQLRDEPSYDSIYGFSGGGYDVLHILNQLKAEELERIHLIVVLGAPPGKNGYPDESNFKPDSFARKFRNDKIRWELVYRTNPNPGAKGQGWGGGKGGGGYDDVVKSKGVSVDDAHMFGPNLLLWQWKNEHPAQPAAAP
jgi:hypothetical protein